MDRAPLSRARSHRDRCGGACGSRRSQQRSRAFEVGRARHLHEPLVAGNRLHAPAPRLDERRAIGRRRHVARKSVAKNRGHERLRRLGDSQLRAVERLDDALAVDALDGVRDRKHGHRPVPALVQRREHARDHAVLHERPRRVVHQDDRCIVRDLPQSEPHGFAAARPAGHARAHLPAAELFREQDHRLLPAGRGSDDDCVHPVGRVQPLEALRQQDALAEANERLRPICAEPFPATRRGEDGPHAHRAPAVAFFFAAGLLAGAFFAGALVAVLATCLTVDFVAAVFFLPPFKPFAPARTPSSHSAGASSSMSFAYISSLARIFLALTNICFSPVESPFSRSRRDRFRTTSANSRMSPVFILSRLCLKRRFQFLGICVPPPVSALMTTLTMSSPITFRRPTFSAFSDGTLTVMSLCKILIVRYSRFSPRTSRFSFFTTVPAPWCGYTTLSPTLYKPAPFRPM